MDNHSIEELRLPTRAWNALVSGAGVTRIGQLVALNLGELRKIRGMGKHSLAQIEKALHARGLKLHTPPEHRRK